MIRTAKIAGIAVFVLSLFTQDLSAQSPLIGNIYGRKIASLNGNWQYIIDPYETGFYGYRWTERNEKDREAYWNTDRPDNKTDRKEHGYSPKFSLKVPCDWNSQAEKFLYYEGTVWYKRSFDFKPAAAGTRVFLYFGAVNYQATVFLNGKKLGTHKGGFTPFNFEIPGDLLKEKENFLVVKVDNRRYRDEVPTINTDWWNYGGITRDVFLAELPAQFISTYSIRLRKGSVDEVEGWIKFNEPFTGACSVEIPELNWKKELPSLSDSLSFSATLKGLQLWSPEKPKLYSVVIRAGADQVRDRIGFRTIEAKGSSLFLNNKQLFLRGICIHEEIPQQGRRAYSAADARQLLLQAKSLNANMVRLAHYPHNEYMVKMADSLGMLVWSEIPVYWTIEFSNPDVLEKAKTQLNEMISRDRNRASVIIWSVGNETPVHTARTAFMRQLLESARALDNSRLVSAALEVHLEKGVSVVDDPLGEFTDLVAVNEYIGWYAGLPSTIENVKWQIKYDKPFFISETGAEALSGYHGDSLTRWSEEYQEWFYKEQSKMWRKLPSNFCGISPWILNDFRSPRRNNPVFQQGWNNKGVLDHRGKRKKAFHVLKRYYDEMAAKFER